MALFRNFNSHKCRIAREYFWQHKVLQISQIQPHISSGQLILYRPIPESKRTSNTMANSRFPKVTLGPLDDPECAICNENLGEKEPAVRVPCGHIFGAGCIESWLRSHHTCPNCRASIVRDLNYPAYTGSHASTEWTRRPGVRFAESEGSTSRSRRDAVRAATRTALLSATLPVDDSRLGADFVSSLGESASRQPDSSDAPSRPQLRDPSPHRRRSALRQTSHQSTSQRGEPSPSRTRANGHSSHPRESHSSHQAQNDSHTVLISTTEFNVSHLL